MTKLKKTKKQNHGGAGLGKPWVVLSFVFFVVFFCFFFF